MRPGKRISGSVSRKARRAINAIYQLDDGRMVERLALLRDLDNIDKHRRLHIVAAIPDTATLAVEFLDAREQSNVDVPKSKLYRVRLDAKGKVVAKIVYKRPVTKPDPEFSLDTVLVFDDEGLPRKHRGRPVASVLWPLWSHLRWEAVPLFEALFV
jgi:hypothetical protein